MGQARRRSYIWAVPEPVERQEGRAGGELRQQSVTIKNHARPSTTMVLLVLSDGAAIMLAATLALVGRGLLDGAIASKLDLFLSLSPGVFLFIIAYGAAGLYPGTGLMAPEELRRTFYATTSIFLGLAATVYMAKEGDLYSRGAFVLAWALAVVLVPGIRMTLRRVCARKPWWGQAAIVLGAGKTGTAVVRKLKQTRRLGLTPVAVLDDNHEKHGMFIDGAPVVGKLEQAPRLRGELGIDYVIVAMPTFGRSHLMEVINRYCREFPSQIVIPDLEGFSSLWVARRDLNGVLGLEVKQQLLLPGPKLLKRVLDLALIGVLAVPVVAVTVLVALLIKLESRGPVFYAQERIGPGGRRIKVWKFRTVIWNADKVLQAHLEKHPELREEWQRDHKLRNDPRVTRMGRLLRRASLDELPQFWNVLKGEMSLVGPRPIVQAETLRYGASIKEYMSVRPGVTGLWQISGRNDTGYAERVALDSYYVRNWSPWLDLYILVKTVGAVISRNGAY